MSDEISDRAMNEIEARENESNDKANDKAVSSRANNDNTTAGMKQNENNEKVSAANRTVTIIPEGDRLKKNLLLLLSTFLLGILFVYLFYGKLPGVSVPIFVLAFYAVMIYYTKDDLSRDSVFGWFLAFPVFLLSFTYFLYGNVIFLVLNLMALPMLILLQTLLVTGCNSFKWYVPGVLLDLFLGIFYRCFVHFKKPFVLIAALLRTDKGKRRVNPLVGRILAGLLVSVPLVLLLISLLASADLVFGIYVNKIPNIFESFKIDDFVAKAIIALLIFFLSFSYLWSLGLREKPGNSISQEIRAKPFKILEPATVITIMVTVNTVYIAFVLIQFAYLFGGSSFALPADFTYAEYARRGFFELIAVTIINLLIIGCFLSFTKTGDPDSNSMQPKILRSLYSMMVACTLIMLVSAHFRMSLYEDAYGFTYLRVFTHFFMAFLFVIFIITLIRIWSDRVKLFRASVVTAIAAFVIINYLNVDAIIAQKNVERFYNTGKIDVQYLTGLSYDALPELAKLADCKDEKVASAVKAYLEKRAKEFETIKPWQSFNLAEQRAGRALETFTKQ